MAEPSGSSASAERMSTRRSSRALSRWAASSPAWISVRRASRRGRGAFDRRAASACLTAASATCQRARSSGFALAWSRSVISLAHDPVDAAACSVRCGPARAAGGNTSCSARPAS